MEVLLCWSPTKQPCMVLMNELHRDLEEDVRVTCLAIIKRTGQATLPSSSINSLLVQISKLTRLMEMAECCNQVSMLQNSTRGNRHLFQSLVFLLGHSRHLLRYSSCKLLCALLVRDAEIAEKLSYLHDVTFQKIPLISHEQLEDTDSNKYYRLLMTLDLLRLLWKMSVGSLNASPKIAPSCICDKVEPSKNVETSPQILHAVESFSFIRGVFRTLLTRKQIALPESIVCECDIYGQLSRMHPQKIDILFTTYLKLLKSVMKRTWKELNHTMEEDINFIVGALAKFRFSRISLRLTMKIVTMFLLTNQRTPKDECDTDMDSFLVLTAHHLCDLCTEEWLHSLPYHSGCVGFGGIDCRKSDVLEQPLGDRPLLRKLAMMIMAAAVIMTDRTQKGPNNYLPHVYSSIHQLQRFVTSKQSTCSTVVLNTDDWLSDLFADDDDDQVVLLLLQTLKIYKNVTKTGAEDLPENHKASTICLSLKIPNPHQIFWNYLRLTDHDPSVMLDLLMSSETRFLEYFTCYSLLMKSEWIKAKKTFQDLYKSGANDSVMPSSTHEVGIGDSDKMTERIEHIADMGNSDCPNFNSKICDLTFQGGSSSLFGERYPVNPRGNCSNSNDDHVPLIDRTLKRRMQDEIIDKEYLLQRERTFHEKRRLEAAEIANEKNRSTNCETSSLSEKESSSVGAFGKGVEVGIEKGLHDDVSTTTDENDLKIQYDVNHQLEVMSAHVDILEEGDDESGVTDVMPLMADEVVDVNHGLDEVFTVLIRLRLSLERLQGKEMFPYSVNPLIQLLEDLEALYEA